MSWWFPLCWDLHVLKITCLFVFHSEEVEVTPELKLGLVPVYMCIAVAVTSLLIVSVWVTTKMWVTHTHYVVFTLRYTKEEQSYSSLFFIYQTGRKQNQIRSWTLCSPPCSTKLLLLQLQKSSRGRTSVLTQWSKLVSSKVFFICIFALAYFSRSCYETVTTASIMCQSTLMLVLS